MYELSKRLTNCYIAGFSYWDGPECALEIKVGDKVKLKHEADNPHDSCAVAVYWKKFKLGYIPKAENQLLSTLLFYGHTEALTTVISQIDLTAHPERQVRIAVSVVDARKDSCL